MPLQPTRAARAALLALACFAATLGAGCGPNEPAMPTTPGTTTPQSTSRTLIRAANFAADLPQVAVVVDGATRISALGYGRVTSYQEIAAGTHRVEFRASDPKLAPPDPLQVTVSLSTGEAATVSAAGLVETHSLQAFAFSDDLRSDSGRARLKFVNAVPDFPAGFDLASERTGVLFTNVGFRQATAYRDLEQGNYDLEVRRNETLEVVIPLAQGLARNATYTVFAFGSLRRGDFSGRVVLDAGAGAAAARWQRLAAILREEEPKMKPRLSRALRLSRMSGAFLLLAGLSAAAQPGRSGSELLLDPDAPELNRRAPDRFEVRLDTSKGALRLEIHRGWSPRGVDRFYNLVGAGYYDGARFFRVIQERWAQFGIHGDPRIAKVWGSRTIPDDPPRRSNLRGTLAYAFAVPNGRTTQVFINLRDNSKTHDAEPFVPFGRIVEGLEVADSLNAEYGESAGSGIRSGKQGPLFEGGNAYLAREFPRLDYIVRARVVER